MVGNGLVWVVCSTVVNVFEDIPESVESSYVKQIIDSLGYNDIVKLHFLDPRKTLQEGVRYLGFDTRTFDPFLSLLLQYRVIHLYCEHEMGVSIGATVGGGASIGATVGTEGAGYGSFVELLTGVGAGYSAPKSEPVAGLEVDYGSEGTNEDDEEYVITRDRVNQERIKEMEYEMELHMLQRVADSKGKESSHFVNDWEGGSDIVSASESEDEDDYGYLTAPELRKRHRFSSEIDNTDTTFFVGKIYENAVMFRKALSEYCISTGRNVKLYRNDPNRVGEKCKNYDKGCSWKIWASWEKDKRNFMVKTHRGEHTCGRTPRISQMNSSWIANYLANRFRVNPYMKIHDIVETIWLEKGIKVSRLMAYRARKRGQALIIGEYEEQYGLLPRYTTEILRSNRGNTVKLHMTANVFQRLYLGFESLRKGFLAGCRPFISLDGCFLKEPYGGQLLVAVERDGNNHMLPISWAVVEVESTETWTWFLSLLATDLGIVEGVGYTFMSDQQKGLLAAIGVVFPEAEARVCVRLVYINFRSVFGGGLEFRKQFWFIAKSSTENGFMENIEVMRAISEETADDLMNINYKKWCRAFYSSMACCDSVDNNMSEVFNAYILGSRHKPIITMLEDIREGLMERLHKKRDEIGKKEIYLCPRIQQRLEKIKIWAKGWNAFWDGGFTYGVMKGETQEKFVVNLQNRTCSCNAWQVSGIPCKHAVVAIWNKVDEPEHYVSEYFTKDTYLNAYDFLLEPLNGPQEWPVSDAVVIAPPLKKVQGRPKTKRRYQQGKVTASGRLRKTGTSISFGLCGLKGHNKRGCKNVTQERQQQRSTQPPPEHTKPYAGNISIPMHFRGVGVYTYPNGYQRIATDAPSQHQTSHVPTQNTAPQPQRGTSYYTDIEGEQTVYSFSQEYPMSSQQSQQTTISSQALQDLARAKRTGKH